MNNLELLSFNYQKSVNNLSNQSSNTIKNYKHKMKHTKVVAEYEKFYSMQSFNAEEFTGELQDLKMYEKWLGSDGVQRD